MVSPQIDNVRTSPYYIWTIVNAVIGNQSLLKVSNWLDHLKCVCLDGIVLIVYVCYWTFRSLAVDYLFVEGPFIFLICIVFVLDLQLFPLPRYEPLAPALLCARCTTLSL